jgi:hypothetical protein
MGRAHALFCSFWNDQQSAEVTNAAAQSVLLRQFFSGLRAIFKDAKRVRRSSCRFNSIAGGVYWAFDSRTFLELFNILPA